MNGRWNLGEKLNNIRQKQGILIIAGPTQIDSICFWSLHECLGAYTRGFCAGVLSLRRQRVFTRILASKLSTPRAAKWSLAQVFSLLFILFVINLLFFLFSCQTLYFLFLLECFSLTNLYQFYTFLDVSKNNSTSNLTMVQLLLFNFILHLNYKNHIKTK